MHAANSLRVFLFLQLGLGRLFDRSRNHPSLGGKNGLARLRRPVPGSAMLAPIVRRAYSGGRLYACGWLRFGASPQRPHFHTGTPVDAAHPRVDLLPRSMDQAYLPKSVLYATSACIGGVGLDAVALETLRGLKDQLGLAIAYGLRTSSTGEQFSTADAWLRQRHLVKNLIWHPVRLLSNLQSRYYYAAKKRAVDSVAAKSLRTGRFDLFHGWSGEALQSLQAAKSLGIPAPLEIPTWNRQKGKTLPPKTEQRCRERVVQHFTWDHFRERLQGAYRAALKLKSNQPRMGTNGHEEKSKPQMNADARR